MSSEKRYFPAIVWMLPALLFPAVSLFSGCGTDKATTPPIGQKTTALHEAAAGGNPQTVEELLQDGGDINSRDEFGMTPLHHAAANGHGQTVSALLELGADPSLMDQQGRSAHQLAGQNGHSATVLLLPADAQTSHVTSTTSEEQVAPAPRVTTPLHEAAASGNPASVTELVGNGAVINAPDESGMTPLHHAAANGHGQTVSTLLELGADAALKDQQGRTARQLAHQNGHAATALLLPAEQQTSRAPSDPARQGVNPSLKYADADAFGAAIGEPACLLTSEHVHLLAPRAREKEANIVFPYLVNAYDALYAMVGAHTEYILMVYNFPKGHAEAFGGTSNCALYYDDANLKLEGQTEWQQHTIPHVSGYIEEMAHNFVSATKAQFGWEMVGWSIGMAACETVANNPTFAAHLRDTRDVQARTYRSYKEAGGVFPPEIEENLVDRIHAHVLWQCAEDYGKNFWPDFFREIKKEKQSLADAAGVGDADAIRNRRYQITLECFDRLPGLHFKDRLRDAHISLETDVKSLHPTEPTWDRRLG